MQNIVGRNIHRFRTARGLSLERLGKRARWDKKNLHNLERSGTGYSHDSLSRLAEALNVNLGALFDETFGLPVVPLDVYTPEMIRRDAVGQTTIDRPPLVPGEIRNVIFAGAKCSDDSFGFTINDAALRPQLGIGDMVIVDPNLSPEPNDLVLAAIFRSKTGRSEVVVRKYAERQDGFELLPEVQAYSSERPVNDNIGIVGTVVEARLVLRRQLPASPHPEPKRVGIAHRQR